MAKNKYTMFDRWRADDESLKYIKSPDIKMSLTDEDKAENELSNLGVPDEILTNIWNSDGSYVEYLAKYKKEHGLN